MVEIRASPMVERFWLMARAAQGRAGQGAGQGRLSVLLLSIFVCQPSSLCVSDLCVSDLCGSDICASVLCASVL